jgi:mycoredoxin
MVQQYRPDLARELGNEIIMYTTEWCGDCWRAKQMMQSMQISFQEIDITEDEEATELVVQLNNGHRSVPTILFPDGTVLTEPPLTVLMQKLKEQRQAN